MVIRRNAVTLSTSTGGDTLLRTPTREETRYPHLSSQFPAKDYKSGNSNLTPKVPLVLTTGLAVRLNGRRDLLHVLMMLADIAISLRQTRNPFHVRRECRVASCSLEEVPQIEAVHEVVPKALVSFALLVFYDSYVA